MHSRRLWSAAAIIAIVLIVGFALSVPRVRDLTIGKPVVSPSASSSTPVVALRDGYKKGIHTITAQVPIPDACTTVSGEASVMPTATGTPESIQIALQMPPDSGICLQEPATTTLSYTLAANAGDPIIVSINGTDASTSPY